MRRRRERKHGPSLRGPWRALSEAVRWLTPDESPFGIEVLDCRQVALSLTTTAGDASIAARFGSLRRSDGSELRGLVPEDGVEVHGSLSYPGGGVAAVGPLFKAEEMEDKWDVYAYDDAWYFARSWTGDLIYRADVERVGDELTIRRAVAGDFDGVNAIRCIDFLIKSHVFGGVDPTHCWRNCAKNTGQLVMGSFSLFGRRGLFGTFEDTIPHGRP
jgi:hypothetical protein